LIHFIVFCDPVEYLLILAAGLTVYLRLTSSLKRDSAVYM